VAELQRLGRTNVFADSLDQQVCILLEPSKTPVLPPNNKALVEYRRGWTIDEQTQEGKRHWTGGDATLSFFSEKPAPAMFVLAGNVVALTARKVELIYEGSVVWSQDMPASSSVPLRIELNGMPGRNFIYVKTDKPGTVPQVNSMRVAVGFGNLTVTEVTK